MWYWYLICVGSGLVVAVAMLIWALVERSKRRAGEVALAAAKAETVDVSGRLSTARLVVTGLQDELAREKAHTAGLRASLEEALQRLLACDDPGAVRDWIKSELKGETL